MPQDLHKEFYDAFQELADKTFTTATIGTDQGSDPQALQAVLDKQKKLFMEVGDHSLTVSMFKSNHLSLSLFFIPVLQVQLDGGHQRSLLRGRPGHPGRST